MFFFKPKAKSDELLPPPPPFPSMTEEEKKLGNEQMPYFPEKDDSSDLMKEFDLGSEQNTKISKKYNAILKKNGKKSKIHNKSDKQKREVIDDFDVKNMDFGLEDNDFNFPDQISWMKNEVYPISQKPKEVVEAQQEIKEAIEKIKKPEKLSLIKRIFGRKDVIYENVKMGDIAESVDDVTMIKKKIGESRNALMGFDLKAAKRNYVEAMTIYNRFSEIDKGLFYQELKDLYSERKSAEKLR